MSDRQADVLIVGGGLSGLETAWQLKQNGISALVLEARDRVGGRTWSKVVGKGALDLGGQWIGPNQRRLNALAARLGVETYPTYHDGRKVLHMGDKISTYTGSIPSLSWLALIRLHLALRSVDKATADIPLERPWDFANAKALDTLTVDTFAKDLWPGSVRRTFDIAVRTVFGAEPSELSLLHFLFYLNAGGGLMSLVEVSGGAQERRFVGGAQQLAIRLAESLGDAVITGAPTRRIDQREDGVTVTTDAGVYTGKYAVVAVPPTLAGGIQYHPRLPQRREQLTQRMPMGHTTKVHLLYERPFWREAGFSGEAVCDGEPVTFTIDNTNEEDQATLVAFLVGEPGRRWGARPEAERHAAILDQVAKYFGDAIRSPQHIVEQDWSTERWTGGCPTGSMPPGVMSLFGDTLRAPCGRIYWAGTETATEGNGYMEGALQAAERVTKEVLPLI